MIEKRIVKIGNFETGKRNNICDVNGVLVGHSTVESDNVHTGITAILPHNGNMFREKVVGASYSYNGYGKSMGLIQVEELGTIETPILLTNTLNIGKVSDGLISYMIKDNPEIGVSTSTVNPIVMECNDGSINEIQLRVLDESNVIEAIKIAGESSALEITEKTVTLPAATAERLGLVKLSAEIGVNDTGALEVKSLNVNKLTQTDGEWLIMNGGTAAL